MGSFLYRAFSQELRLGALHPLPKAIGSGHQVRPKTLLKGANNVGSCCLARPKTLQNRVGCGYRARPTGLGSGWAVGPNILGSGCAAISNDIIICIINIIFLL